MKYVNYPFSETKRLSFYLATEEFLAKHYPKDEYFFMWQVNPTVIIGRNQLIDNEVNVKYAKEKNIQLYRRKSGGGCVYADFSNIMFSFITPNFNKNFVFKTYLSRIVKILRDLGLDAKFSGRNDILIGELKVSGNAFYQVNSRSVVHGTMLYNTDFNEMIHAITPDNEKLISPGIDSVRKRVTNVKDHLDITIEDFKAFIKKNIADEDMTLSESDIKEIEKIEASYLSEQFIYGKNPNYTLIKKGKVKAGLFEISLELKNQVIKKMNILGDYFIVQDEDELVKLLINQKYDKDTIEKRLKEVDVSDYIYDLSNEDFIGLLFKD
jgi:lipoyltransferase/lipoate-protein ligase